MIAAVDLRVRSGELVALIGPNGSGKSSLLGALAGVVPLAAGEVFVGGQPLGVLRVQERARLLTLVSQDTHVSFGLPVEEVIAQGRLPYLERFAPMSVADHEAVSRALDALGIGHLAGRPVNQISGGERQRVHIARAHAQDTPVVLLDEPTASLDLAHQLRVLGVLRRLCDGGRAILVALHDLNMAARFADRIVALHAGRVAAEGPPGEVLREELLAEVFRVRARCQPRGASTDIFLLDALDDIKPPAGARERNPHDR